MDIDTVTCKICNKQLSTKFKLKAHMLVHSNAKPFSCAHCSETFTYNEPEQMFQRTFFKLSYEELEKHHLKVDMWKVAFPSYPNTDPKVKKYGFSRT